MTLNILTSAELAGVKQVWKPAWECITSEFQYHAGNELSI